MSFKIWLRGPADDPQVEVIGEHAWWLEGSHRNRSVMSELLTEEENERLQVGEGRWLLPGTPP